MRESMGNTLLLYIVIIFSGIIMLFFVGILSYSKAYKVKNRIIEIIEKYGSYSSCSNGEKCAVSEINESLKETGYNVSSKDLCNKSSVQDHLKKEVGVAGTPVSLNNPTSGYNYCVFEINNKTSSVTNQNAVYYVVVTFVHFDVPIIGDFINIPVYGETKYLGKNYNY